MKEKLLRILRKIAIISGLLLMVALSATGCFGGGNRPLGWSGVAVSGNEIYFGTQTSKLISLNRNTGTVRWQIDLPNAQGIYGSPLVVGDSVYVATYSGRIFAVTTAGVLKWSSPSEDVKLPDAIISGLAYSDGRLYYGSTDGKVYALDASTGGPVWDFETGDKIWATPLIEDGVVYIGSFDNKFYALAATDGREIWQFEAEGVFIAAPVIDGENVIVGSLDRNLYGLDKTTGAFKWQFKGEKWFWGSPILVGDRVYAPNTDGKVYAMDSADGSDVAEFTFETSIASSPAVVANRIVVADENGVLSIIDLSTQQTQQLFDLETTVRAPLTAAGDVVYVHSQSNETIYALNATTGTQLWQYKVQ